jgi:DNA ligase-1
MIFPLPTLYKRDTNGNIRELTVEYSRGVLSATRTIAGIKDGNLVTSGWKNALGKNEGKANATTDGEQAEKEAKAMWDKKVEKEYFEDISLVDTYDKFKPQLAHDYTKRPQDSGWSQPKLDGIRCIARKDGLYTRAGKSITTCDHIFSALQPFFKNNPQAILDGELYNHDLREDFNKITSLVRKVKPTEEEQAECFKLVQYHVYDMAGEDLFQARINFINDQVFVDPIVCVATNYCSTQSKLDDLYSEYIGNGFEGQMVRNNTPYENKRSKNLLKRKEFITEEFDVVEVLEGSGNWAGYAKHFTLKLQDGRTFGSGVRGTQAVLKELLEQEVQPTWVTCRFFELSPDGVPRFPVVIDWGIGARDD